MENRKFDQFTKAQSLEVSEIESKSLNFDEEANADSGWYVLFGNDFVFVVDSVVPADN